MSAALDFVDAVIQQLSAVCGTAFGESLPNYPKFGTDWVGQDNPPYCVLTEISGPQTYTTPRAEGIFFIAENQLAVSILGVTSKRDVRTLGDEVEKALNDQETALIYTNGRCMMIRSNQDGAFVPMPDIGPGSPTIFHYVFTFSYALQRSF